MMQTTTPLRTLLIEKSTCESALLIAKDDPIVRARYFAALADLAANRSGLLHAVLPEYGMPLYLRAGSADVAALRRVVLQRHPAWLPEAAPRRILDIGAHAGYVAAQLALRYPDAEILCVEPDADTRHVLTLNTLPLGNVKRSGLAAWHSPARLGAEGRDEQGWGPRLTDRLPPAALTIAAQTVPALLNEAGMADADMVLCDTGGAEAAIFADPNAAWLAQVDFAAITAREDIVPGTEAVLAAAFPTTLFDSAQHGAVTLFRRRAPARRDAPRHLPLLHTAPGLLAYSLHDVPEGPWGFFIFDGGSCQLHPNPPGGPPASVRFIRTLAGQTRLTMGIAHAGHEAGDIHFAATLVAADGAPLAHRAKFLSAGATGRLDLNLPPGLSGRYRIILETALQPGAADNHRAWARFISPVLS